MKMIKINAISRILREYGIASMVEIGLVLLWRVFPWPRGRGRYAVKRLIWEISRRIGKLDQFTPVLTDVGWMLLNREHDVLQRHIYMNGTHYETRVVQFAKTYIHKGDIVLDIGAHAGYYTLLFAQKVGPEGLVIAFEPQLQLAEAIAKSLELNNIKWVIIERRAISDRNGKLILFQPKDTGRTSVAGRLTQEDQVIEVETVSLDEYCFNTLKKAPSLIKMDIEGGEWLAVRGMEKILSISPPCRLLIEMHPSRIAQLGGTSEEVVNLLERHGYSLYWLHHKHGIQKLPLSLPACTTWHLLAEWRKHK